MFQKLRRNYRTARWIRAAIDTYPDGICFASSDGRPILANQKINAVCHALTGHTITNANAMWNELKQMQTEECLLDFDIVSAEMTGQNRKEQIIHRLSDGSIWQFQKQSLAATDPAAGNGPAKILQYEAADITQLYQYRSRLLDNNLRSAGLHERQRELLQNIVQNNLDKEILNAKMRIHDEFGRLLIMTRNALTEGEIGKDTSDLFPTWKNIIADMENAAMNDHEGDPSPEKELMEVADMIGCCVKFHGKQPCERKALLLLYAAIREALTNAVRHASADTLTIVIAEQNQEYHVEILNNGRTSVTSVKEGGGLGNLRKRLESEGAAMDIRCENGVALILTIPKE